MGNKKANKYTKELEQAREDAYSASAWSSAVASYSFSASAASASSARHSAARAWASAKELEYQIELTLEKL